MDKSYRLKLENWMTARTVNEQLLIPCLAAFDARATKLAKAVEKYRYNSYCVAQTEFAEANAKLQELIEYRKPFIAVLCNGCSITLNEIKDKIATTLNNPMLSKNIPTRQQIDQVRALLVSGEYRAM